MPRGSDSQSAVPGPAASVLRELSETSSLRLPLPAGSEGLGVGQVIVMYSLRITNYKINTNTCFIEIIFHEIGMFLGREAS